MTTQFCPSYPSCIPYLCATILCYDVYCFFGLSGHATFLALINNEMVSLPHIGLHVKCYFCPILTKL